jgi:hypothetical protein
MNQRIKSKQASMMGSSPLEMAWLAGAVMAGFVKISQAPAAPVSKIFSKLNVVAKSKNSQM